MQMRPRNIPPLTNVANEVSLLYRKFFGRRLLIYQKALPLVLSLPRKRHDIIPKTIQVTINGGVPARMLQVECLSVTAYRDAYARHVAIGNSINWSSYSAANVESRMKMITSQLTKRACELNSTLHRRNKIRQLIRRGLRKKQEYTPPQKR